MAIITKSDLESVTFICHFLNPFANFCVRWIYGFMVILTETKINSRKYHSPESDSPKKTFLRMK